MLLFILLRFVIIFMNLVLLCVNSFGLPHGQLLFQVWRLLHRQAVNNSCFQAWFAEIPDSGIYKFLLLGHPGLLLLSYYFHTTRSHIQHYPRIRSSHLRQNTQAKQKMCFWSWISITVSVILIPLEWRMPYPRENPIVGSLKLQVPLLFFCFVFTI